MKRYWTAVAIAVATACSPAAAQETATTRRLAPIAPPAAILLPEGARVEIEVAQTLSSKQLRRGDRFALRLAQPLVSNGVTVFPSGAAGEGEVVHAAPSSGGGKPGELLLAARYVEFEGSRVALRGFTLGGQGKDRTLTMLVVAQGVGPFALFVKGGEIEIPAGTLASAKVAAAIELLPISNKGHPE